MARRKIGAIFLILCYLFNVGSGYFLSELAHIIEIHEAHLCDEYEFMCNGSGNCIPKNLVCNGKKDCPDGEDEMATECEQKKQDCPGFWCLTTNKCLESHKWVCDGYDDCGDGSDEKGCVYNCDLENHKFLCNDNDTCIDYTKVCDGHEDCPNHDDEHGNCDNKGCTDLKCPSTSSCVKLSTELTCVCPKGFRYNEKKNRCQDIDECEEEYGLCSQYCLNTSGSYKCYCAEKYELLEDNRTCQTKYGEGMLFYTTQKSVVQFHLRSKVIFPLASNLSQVVGITFDGEDIYWSDINQQTEVIEKVSLDGNNREVLLTSGVDKVEDISLDWLAGNLYFTDNFKAHIAVCTKDGFYCQVLIFEEIDAPRSIAVLPQNGTMFWTDWGSNPHIGKASMDGTNPRAIVTKDIAWPNGLTIDIFSERIYWIDAKHKKIESVFYDGSDRREVLSDILMHPFSIAIFEDNLYWSDWGTASIHTCHKFTGKDHYVAVKDGHTIYSLHIYHSTLQPKMEHSCMHQPCSHLCLLNEEMSYTCDCPYGWRLSADHHNCVKFLKSKLYMSWPHRDYVMEMEHTLFGRHTLSLSIALHFYIHQMEYNSVNHTHFFVDNIARIIYEYNPKTKELDQLFKAKSMEFNVSAMAFDPLTHNLYWSDASRHTVEVLSLKTRQSAVVHYFALNESPIAMAIFPKLGCMFVALSSSNFHVHIDKFNLNGFGDHLHFLEDDLGDQGIRMIADWSSNVLYWIDTELGQLKYLKIDNPYDKPHVYHSHIASPISLAIVQDDIFWSTKDSNYLFWKHKMYNGTVKRIKTEKSANLLAYSNFNESNFHPCNSNNGGCSHICVSSGARSSSCLCPTGLFFKDLSNKTCIEKEDCEFRCKNGDCITLSRKCNKKKDCTDGSDEDEETCGNNQKKSCSITEFACVDGSSCISTDKRCDKNYDCADKSDELHCEGFNETNRCEKNQFKCGSGECVYTTVVCDGAEDCKDASDERMCRTIKFFCDPDMYQCTSGSCIPKSWECDGKLDCTDGSDEHSDCSTRECPSGNYKCKLGKCIPIALECDEHDDCGDNSDEEHCEREGKRNILCGDEVFDALGETNMFQCPSDPTICLDKRSRCNKTAECPKGEDEQGCTGCGINEFQCVTDKNCIADIFVCDGQSDCDDGSDEKNCDGGGRHHIYYGSLQCHRKGMFDCGDETCIDKFLVCNNEKDCENGADESPLCATSCVASNNPCEQKCVATPHGSTCECHEGYTLYNGSNCTDIDECTTTYPCSQICRNKNGSFGCSCYEGFMLTTDKFACKSIESGHTIYFSSYSEIRSMVLHKNFLDVVFKSNGSKVTGFDIDIQNNTLYYSLEGYDKIFKFDLKSKKTLSSLTVESPRKIAVDWMTQNVYTMSRLSNGLDSIKVCNFKKGGCAVVITLRPRQDVMSMAVDGYNKHIFYAIKQPEHFLSPRSIVFIANLDGSKKEKLYTKMAAEIMGVAIDPYKQEIYLADQHSKSIQLMRYGSIVNMARTIVRQKNAVSIPAGLSVYENEIYIVNVGQNKVVYCKLYSDGSCSDIPINLHNAEDIVVTGVTRQRRSPKNECGANDCSVVCVPAEYSYKCLCQDGSVATDENICPEIPNDIEIYEHLQDDDETSTHSVIGWTLFAVAILVAVVSGGYYYHQRYPNLQRHFNDTIHFQNPLSKICPERRSSSGYGPTVSSASSSVSSICSMFQDNENGTELVLENQPNRNGCLSRVKYRATDENVLLSAADSFDSS